MIGARNFFPVFASLHPQAEQSLFCSSLCRTFSHCWSSGKKLRENNENVNAFPQNLSLGNFCSDCIWQNFGCKDFHRVHERGRLFQPTLWKQIDDARTGLPPPSIDLLQLTGRVLSINRLTGQGPELISTSTAHKKGPQDGLKIVPTPFRMLLFYGSGFWLADANGTPKHVVPDSQPVKASQQAVINIWHLSDGIFCNLFPFRNFSA